MEKKHTWTNFRLINNEAQQNLIYWLTKQYLNKYCRKCITEAAMCTSSILEHVNLNNCVSSNHIYSTKSANLETKLKTTHYLKLKLSTICHDRVRGTHRTAWIRGFAMMSWDPISLTIALKPDPGKESEMQQSPEIYCICFKTHFGNENWKNTCKNLKPTQNKSYQVKPLKDKLSSHSF